MAFNAVIKLQTEYNLIRGAVWSGIILLDKVYAEYMYLTLKAPITTAADDKFCDIFF